MQELAEEFAGRRVDMIIMENPEQQQRSILGSPNASLARKLLSTRSVCLGISLLRCYDVF